ncbi:MAG TPA: PDZ domain-containing protein [Vicinamibacterales bacterium]|nr:PDZ domain-containing protein [Vicinamibacterales bacterium]
MSRETRLLLTTGVVAIAALWLLARIRFEDRAVTPNPVPSVFSQLSTSPKYDDLASQIAQIQARLQPSLLALDVPSAALGSPRTSHRIAAFRLRDDLAVTWLPAGSNPAAGTDANVLARDPATGLAVMRVASQPSASAPMPWSPRRLQQPRYVVASEVAPQGLSLRPVFVGSLDPVESPLWSAPLWVVPPRSDLTPGSFVFTSDAELVGLVIAISGSELAIVPGGTVLTEADRVLNTRPRPPGTIGLEVQPLTASVASVTGASEGVVVTWVAGTGTATGQLFVGDVIEAVDGRGLVSRQQWDARIARLSAGETLTLRVRRRGALQDVALAAAAIPAQPRSPSLGLTLARRGIGAEVVRVEPGSAADRAGLEVGDVITAFADIHAPTPAQITRSFAAIDQGQRVLIAVTRRDAHHVTTLER